MDERVKEFLLSNHAAVMVTLRRDGTPHVARVAVGLVGDNLWSSGTEDRLRTLHLRADNRASLCVLGDSPWTWLGLDTRVRLLEGDEGREANLQLYRVLRGEPDDLAEYREAMVREKRLIYAFDLIRAYGQY